MTRKKSRIILIVLICLCLIFSALALYMFRDRFIDSDGVVTKKGFDREKAQQNLETETAENSENNNEQPPQKKKYECPVDFKKLREINPDIYAWIDIPGTVVSYPVVQSSDDKKFYLDHNSDGDYSIEGALFTEAYYNEKDFEDPLTVIYGHYLSNGELFGSLQKDYSNAEFFEKHKEIHIYMEDGMKTYTVFAAVPYGRAHLTAYYNFASPRVFKAFMDDLYSIRDVSAVISENAKPEYGDKILTLSTCFWGNNDRRYLVFAAEHNENKK